MKLVFLGTPRVATAALDALVNAGHRVVGVITRADRPVGRSGRPSPPPIKQAALAHGIDVHQPTRVRNEAFRGWIAEREPEAVIVVAYGRILPPPVLAIAAHGAINVHFSLLPEYRGAAPVQWALARGETVTGVTTMRMSEGLDEGDVLLQERVPVLEGEHAPALSERLARAGAQLLLETLKDLERIAPQPQDHARATFAPPLSPEDGRVAPSRLAAREIEGRVRGFDPWPGVWLQRGRRRVRLLEVAAIDGTAAGPAPGTVTDLEHDALVLVCASGTRLAVGRLQVEGRRPMSARDAVNGRQLGPGDRLEPIVVG